MAAMRVYYVHLRRVTTYQPRRMTWRIGVTSEQIAPEPGVIESFMVRATSRDEAIANIMAHLSGRQINLQDTEIEA